MQRQSATYSREVDVPRLEVQIHQVECDTTLQIPLYSVDGDLTTDVKDPTETQIGLRDCIVHRLVCRDPFPEISLGFGFCHILVIWIARLNLERDVCSDDGGVITKRFEEEELQCGFLLNTFGDPSSTFECAVCRV